MLLWLVLSLGCACDAYKILVIFPLPSPSHGILGDGVVRVLANAGHDVTYITPFPAKIRQPKVRVIDVSSNFDTFMAIDLNAIMKKEQSMTNPLAFFEVLKKMNTETVANENVQKLLYDPNENFDLVITEWIFSDFTAGYAPVFNCPYIWVSSIEAHSQVLSLIDEPTNPSYNAGPFSSGVPPFGFFERAKELAFHLMYSLINYYFEGQESKYYEEYFGPAIRKRGRPVPPFGEVKRNASLMFGNSHVSLGQATRLPQNYKPIRGYHIDPEVKPLPKDLKQILDNAKNGLIYFSMGSNLKSKDMPDDLKRSLLQMFGTFKQTVLWKFEESLPGLPSNVHIVQWAPQPSILAHQNCIIFVTHGGGLSSTEAIHFGKPTIGIPVFGDQFINVDKAVTRGHSLRVDLAFDMAEKLKEAIEEMLRNQSYAVKAKELSFVYHHRPVPPGVEMVHWVEHVVRTRGAPHLRSPALGVPFYQKVYLDLAAVLLVTTYVLIKTLKFICKRFICSRTKPSSSKKKNK